MKMGALFNTENQPQIMLKDQTGHPVADHQKDFSSVYKPFWFNYINSEGIAFPFFCIYLHILYYKACKWLKYNWSLTYSFQSRVVSKFQESMLSPLQSDPTVSLYEWS
jgi:hypothetical protein